jgi:hypothetical protein
MGERLLVEPVKKPTHLLELLAALEPIEDTLPDVDAGLPALDDVRLCTVHGASHRQRTRVFLRTGTPGRKWVGEYRLKLGDRGSESSGSFRTPAGGDAAITPASGSAPDRVPRPGARRR